MNGFISERWICDGCGEEKPERTKWNGDGSVSRVPGNCSNPDCPESGI